MTQTIRERILAAFTTKLENITTVIDLNVERNRTTEVTKYPTLIVIDGNQSTDNSNTSFTTYQLQVSVEGYVQDDADKVGSAVNTLYGETVKAILADITLGNLCFDIQEEDMVVDLDRGEGHAPQMAFLLQFSVSYMTKQNDPYTLAP